MEQSQRGEGGERDRESSFTEATNAPYLMLAKSYGNLTSNICFTVHNKYYLHLFLQR